MHPTQVLRGGADVPLGKYNKWLGHWGHLGLQKQKGIITYGISPNRQNPFAGAGHDAVFNVWRRFYAHVFYWAPPMLVTYYVLDWAKKRNKYLNSKAGRREFGQGEEE